MLWALLDLNRLQVMPVGFPLSGSGQAADVVIRAPLREGGVWIYWLIELQASADGTMSFRVLNYKLEMIRYHLQSEEGRHNKCPPILLSIVVYSGKAPWDPGELDLFSPLPPQFREIGRRGFSGGCDFVNVADVDVEALQESPGLQATTLFLQRAYAPDKLQVLQQAQPLLERVYAQPGGDALGDAMIRYMLHESGHQRGLAAKLMVKAITDNLSGVVKGKTMSIAQVLRNDEAA